MRADLARLTDIPRSQPALRPVEAPEVTARLILESALWASQRRMRDRESAAVSDADARAAFIDLARATLSP